MADETRAVALSNDLVGETFQLGLPAVSERKQIEQEMSPKLLEAAEQILELASRDATRCLTNYVRIGGIVADVKNAPNTYGSGAVASLGKYLQIAPGKLYLLARVAETFELEPLQNVLYANREEKRARLTANGQPVRIGHLVAIAQIQDDGDPYDILEQVYTNGWSTNELKDRLAKVEKKAVRSGGRKPSKPATPALLAHKTSKMFAKVNNFVNENQDSLHRLQSIDDDECCAELRAQVVEVLQEAEELAGTAELAKKECEAALSHIDKIMLAAEEAAEKENPRVRGRAKPAPAEKPKEEAPQAKKAKAKQEEPEAPPAKKTKAKQPELFEDAEPDVPETAPSRGKEVAELLAKARKTKATVANAKDKMAAVKEGVKAAVKVAEEVYERNQAKRARRNG